MEGKKQCQLPAVEKLESVSLFFKWIMEDIKLLWYLDSTGHLKEILNFLFWSVNIHFSLNFHDYNIKWRGFPGGAVVENMPANAGDTGSSPGLGRSYVPRSGWAREPQLLSLRVWSPCSATREAAIVKGPRTAMKSGPRLPQLEKALAQKRRPNTAINK